jgi:hypothetical protein
VVALHVLHGRDQHHAVLDVKQAQRRVRCPTVKTQISCTSREGAKRAQTHLAGYLRSEDALLRHVEVNNFAFVACILLVLKLHFWDADSTDLSSCREDYRVCCTFDRNFLPIEPIDRDGTFLGAIEHKAR